MSRKRRPDALVVDRKEFADALQSLRPIVRKVGNGILRCALMRAGSCPDAPCLTISASNMETTLSIEIAREGGPGEAEEFAALVDLERLAAFAAADWGETLSLGLTKERGGRLEVEGRTAARIVDMYPENYPELPQPPETGGVELSHEVIEEISRARRFINPREYENWTRVVHVVERGSSIDIFAGNQRRAWWRKAVGGEAPAGFAVGLTQETAALLAAQAGKASVYARRGERQDFFSGSKFLLAQTRPVHEPAPIEWLEDPRMLPESWQEMIEVVNVLSVVEAVAQEAGERNPLFFTENNGSTLVSAKSDLVDAEGAIPGAFPIYKTGYPADLLQVLRELDRTAGTERKIEVGRFGSGNLRFRIEGLAEALVSGMK